MAYGLLYVEIKCIPFTYAEVFERSRAWVAHSLILLLIQGDLRWLMIVNFYHRFLFNDFIRNYTEKWGKIDVNIITLVQQMSKCILAHGSPNGNDRSLI